MVREDDVPNISNVDLDDLYNSLQTFYDTIPDICLEEPTHALEKVSIEEEEEAQQEVVYDQPSIEKSKIILNFTKDPFQEIYISSFLKNLDIPVVHLDFSNVTNFKQYQYLKRAGLFVKPEVLVISLNGKIKEETIQFIESMYLKQKHLILKVDFIGNYNMLKAKIFKEVPEGFEKNFLPLSVTYNDKKEIVFQYLTNTKLRFKGKKEYELMSKVIISRIKEFSSLSFKLKVLEDSGIVLTEAIIKDAFSLVEFYNLSEMFDLILRGTDFKKTITMLQYFSQNKNYPYPWIYQQFLEFVYLLNLFYFFKTRGIIKHHIPKDVFENRVVKAGYEKYAETLENLSSKELRILLNLTNDLPYTYTCELTKIVFHKDLGVVDSKEDFYALLLSLQTLKPRYQQPKGFIDSEKMENIKKNARYRKKRKD